MNKNTLKNQLKILLSRNFFKTYLIWIKWFNQGFRNLKLSRKELRELIDYPGMISPNEKLILAEYAYETKENIVEFGVYLGASTYALAFGRSKSNNKNKKIYA